MDGRLVFFIAINDQALVKDENAIDAMLDRYMLLQLAQFSRQRAQRDRLIGKDMHEGWDDRIVDVALRMKHRFGEALDLSGFLHRIGQLITV